MNEIIKRGPGRPRKEPLADVARPQTAQERIDEIRLLEFKGNGYIVPRPDELTMETLRTWLRETAEIGSGDHVALVWQYGNQHKAWRDKLMAPDPPKGWLGYHGLIRQAGARWAKLQDAAKAEQEKAAAEYQKRALEANKQRAIAQAEAKLAALKAAG